MVHTVRILSIIFNKPGRLLNIIFSTRYCKEVIGVLFINLGIIFNGYSTIFTVDNIGGNDDFAAAAPGTMTFAKCIRLAKADATGGAGGHRIYFNIAPAGQKIILVTSWLQLDNTNLNNMIVDATTQPFVGTGPHVILASSGISEGLQLTGVTNVTIMGFGIRDFQVGIKLTTASNCTITGNFLGTDNAGTGVLCTNCTDDGIKILNGCSNNIIGGTTTGTRNIIFNYYNGISITGATSTGNFIGATTAGEPNVISSNKSNGVYIFNAGANNKVAGNIIGLDIAGTAMLSNQAKGILVQNTVNTIIGGTPIGERNIISGNGFNIGHDGIFLENNCHFSQIINCYIGVNVTATAALRNNIRGILIKASDDCIVGAVGAGNIISGHDEFGIRIESGCDRTIIKANTIGLDINGTVKLPNLIGINIDGSNGTIIGGTAAGEANCISGNDEHGIRIDGSSNTEVVGNKIGTSFSGAVFGNGEYGIYMHNGDNNTIGGATTSHGNEIAYNGASGIGLADVYWPGDPSPASGSDNNFIYRNSIHHNNVDGIRLFRVTNASVKNWFSQNQIYCNGGIGINLTLSTGNNNNKPAPVLTSVNAGTNTLFGTATANDVIEVFIDNACPTCQGRTYLGTTNADGSGNWSFTNAIITSSNNLSATATDAAGVNRNTSQFANCITVLPVVLISFSGHQIETGEVLLNWATASEQDNDYFEIFKSLDGVSFESIGKVKGQGNYSGTTNYTFADNTASNDLVYYKLSQIDFNGSSNSTKMIQVDIHNDAQLSLYPNPTNDKVTVEFSSDSEEVFLNVVNSLGQKVYSEYINQPKGAHSKEINLENLEPGIYILHLILNDVKLEKKIVKR